MIDSLKFSHPNYEELLVYASDEHKASLNTSEHIAQCFACQKEIKVIKELGFGFNNINRSMPSESCGAHLSDEAINEYVYNRLAIEARSEVDQHLEECGRCMKEVLNLRAQIEERTSQQNNHADLIQLKTNQTHNRMVSIVSLAVAASIVIASIVFLLPKNTNESTPISIATTSIQLNPKSQIPTALTTLTSAAELIGNGVQRVNHGLVNWYDGYIETEAVGTVDMSKIVNPVQAEVMAEKTARAMAYAQISEVLGGVQVTQKSSYKDMLMQVDQLGIENASFIRNAQVIEKKLEWIKEVPKVTIKMRVPLRGNSSIQSIVEPYISQRNDAFFKANNLKPNDIDASFDTYTSLVVDVRNTNHRPAMHINLKTGGYDAGFEKPLVAKKLNLSNLETFYYPAKEILKKDRTLGENPYVITVKSIEPSGEIILEPETMSKAIAVLSRQANKNQLAVLF